MPILEVKNLSFDYNNKSVLKNVSLSVNEGEILTLLGPNGAGKTTLLNCLVRFLNEYCGSVFLNGINTKSLTSKQMAEAIAYVPQMGTLSFDYSVKEFVVMGRCSHVGILSQPKSADYAIVQDKLKILGIEHLSERNIGELSGGERQLVYIARALAQEPKIILLDEPTSALDYGNQICTLQLIASLRENGFSIIMTTHNPDHCMMLGGKVAILDRDGNLEYGIYSEVLTEERLKQVYKTDLKLVFLNEVQRTICIPTGLKMDNAQIGKQYS